MGARGVEIILSDISVTGDDIRVVTASAGIADSHAHCKFSRSDNRLLMKSGR